MAQPEVIPGLWITLIKSFAMLSVVIGVLIAVLFLMKRLLYSQGSFSKQSLIQMLASFHVTQKERIMLVDVLGEKILIGVTSNNISCLAKIDCDNAAEIINNSEPDKSFNNLIKNAVAKISRENGKKSSSTDK